MSTTSSSSTTTAKTVAAPRGRGSDSLSSNVGETKTTPRNRLNLAGAILVRAQFTCMVTERKLLQLYRVLGQYGVHIETLLQLHLPMSANAGGGHKRRKQGIKFIPSNGTLTRRILKHLHLDSTETNVLSLTLSSETETNATAPNTSQQLAVIHSILYSHVPIAGCYLSGKQLILEVADVRLALKLLETSSGAVCRLRKHNRVSSKSTTQERKQSSVSSATSTITPQTTR